MGSIHTDFIQWGSSRINYSRWGTGPRLLVCFHGYGERGAGFAFLDTALGHDFTILAIDLPFHGDTDWKEGLFFDPEDLLTLIGRIAAPLPAASGSWTLLGYSMGGRIALGLLQKIPEKIEKLVLAAPDGLKVNGWYWLVTRNRLGNLVFRWTMKRPGWLFFVLKMANKLRLVNRSVYKFSVAYIDNAQVRDELYKRWTTMRGFRPDLSVIKSLIRERHIPVRLIYGRHDRIIRVATGERFSREIAPYGKLVALDAGHRLLQDRNLDTLVALLTD
jgi:pimeloyl-ACP methyl ester carboxylesterase